MFLEVAGAHPSASRFLGGHRVESIQQKPRWWRYGVTTIANGSVWGGDAFFACTASGATKRPHPGVGDRCLRKREAFDLNNPLLQSLRDEGHAVAGVQEALEEDPRWERQPPVRLGVEGVDQRASMELLVEDAGEEAVPCLLGVDHLGADLS